MARQPKEFHEYITEPTSAQVGHEDYLKSPGSAFLKYTVEAKSAIDLCCRKFPRKADNGYRKDSLDSLQHLVTAMIPAIMGHFETYERYLFAGMFDLSAYLQKFEIEDMVSRLCKVSSVSVDVVRLAAYRGLGAESVGLLMADSLAGWHDPKRVNRFFDSFGLKRQLFSRESCDRLDVLWQLRHSIVHTGGTLTVADAQKIRSLSEFGNRKLVFENHLVKEISRKLHPLISESTVGMGNAFISRLETGAPDSVRERVSNLFEVKSSVHAWLRQD